MTIERPRAPMPEEGPAGPKRRVSRRVRRRRGIAIGLAAAVLIGGLVLWTREPAVTEAPSPRPGSPEWALRYYGNPDAPRFKARHIVSMDFLGRTMLVHEKALRHFLRLESLFEARAPEYAALVAAGTLDDWSYENRSVRGALLKSNHAFGLAIDVNALTNVLGTAGDMPLEVVRQWELEGGDWGGDWARPDPMHFETHLTPKQIRQRYNPDGTPTEEYLEELIGG